MQIFTKSKGVEDVYTSPYIHDLPYSAHLNYPLLNAIPSAVFVHTYTYVI